MSALGLSCEVVFDLTGAWYDDELSENDQNAFEQHLLLCPPCLAYSDRLRRALGALAEATTVAMPAELVERLVLREHSPSHSGLDESGPGQRRQGKMRIIGNGPRQ